MILRPECPADGAAIATVTRAAFAMARHSDQTEDRIVERLRRAGALTLSLVAVDDDVIVGHVGFSPVLIDGHACGWYGLGPLSVRPDRQRLGIGQALVRAGLEGLRERGASGCVVLGSPDYYGKFGFAALQQLVLADVPPHYFQALIFLRPAPSGAVSYHPGFYGDIPPQEAP